MWARRCRPGMSPGKEFHSSFSVPLIPGDMSPGKRFVSVLAWEVASLAGDDVPSLDRIDVDENFNPVVKSATIRAILSLAHHLDVKNAFLQNYLSQTAHMHPPPGFRDPL
ncbi:ribonuclease H-like domain-containing protein [Tanacetum coccineum]